MLRVNNRPDMTSFYTFFFSKILMCSVISKCYDSAWDRLTAQGTERKTDTHSDSENER